MSNTQKQPLVLVGASLPFCQYQEDGVSVIEFDSCGCGCPVPMVNAMAGLQHVAEHGGKLVMINGFEPQGLYERIRGSFDWTVQSLSDEKVLICFAPVAGCASTLDFSNNQCRGG